MTERQPILSVQNLNVKFSLRGKTLHAIRDVSLDLYEGEALAIVGESGSGKSVLTKTFMGLLDANGWIESGAILYNGQDLASFRTEKQWLAIRGGEIAMVMQDPMTSLNPLKTIGRQIEEALRLHQGLKGSAAHAKAVSILEDVGIAEPERRSRQYPHEFSGGMRQRVVIAIAIACNPKILICDEPTTALDVTIQAQILRLIRELVKKYRLTTVYITHDLGVVANVADRVAVMYAGDVVEIGTCREVFFDPRHPYTWALLSSLPQLAEKNTTLSCSGNIGYTKSAGKVKLGTNYTSSAALTSVKADKTAVTGMDYRPWHYRYVGRDAAAQIRELNLSLEEYIEMFFAS